ncbi:MAG: rod shape-determining protein MreD [Chitinophagales bacterium]
MNNSFRYISVFIGLVIFQVLVLNNVNLHGLINPYIYPLFILLLPFEISGAALLGLAFFIGLSIDLFMGTIGMHAFATVFMAATRPTIVRLFSQQKTEIKEPSINNNGFTWMVVYVGISLLIHHSVYFLIEASSFNLLPSVLLRILCSSVISLFLCIMLLYAFRKVKKR